MRIKIFVMIFLHVLLGKISQSAAQDLLTLRSSKIPKEDSVWVFKPSSYSNEKVYPAIFLLHGWSGDYKQWHSIMDAQKYADDYGFILVCPDGFYNSWYLNSPLKANYQYVDFFYESLMPKVNLTYKVDTANVFITGLSMGGHGALTIFLEHPELFKSAGSTSGGLVLSASGDKFGISELIGDFVTNKERWDDFSIINKVYKIAGADKQIIFDCGTEDFYYQANNQFRTKCDELKVKATYISQPGSHNRQYWTKSIRQQFDFFKGLVN